MNIRTGSLDSYRCNVNIILTLHSALIIDTRTLNIWEGGNYTIITQCFITSLPLDEIFCIRFEKAGHVRGGGKISCTSPVIYRYSTQLLFADDYEITSQHNAWKESAISYRLSRRTRLNTSVININKTIIFRNKFCGESKVGGRRCSRVE